MKRITCFISYSHESAEHDAKVLALAKKLKKDSFIVKFDKFDLNGGDDFPHFMEKAVAESDKIILICTPTFAKKANNGTNGVGYEKMIITGELLRTFNVSDNKLIPLIFSGTRDTAIPKYVGSKSDIMQKSRNSYKQLTDAIKKNIRLSSVNAKKVNIALPQTHTKLFRLKPYGYRLIGSTGIHGIRVLWTVNGDRNSFVESLAFNSRVRLNASPQDEGISSYTISVSAGCILNPMGLACKFCKTGQLPYKGNLTGYEIALQNVLMIISDINCPNKKLEGHVKNKREFAYMGQGEPGFSYPQIRLAIKLTDLAMKELNQTVHRHLISTAGVPEMIDLFINDMQSKVYGNNVTMHYSLHVTENRNELMPIENVYPFKVVLSKLSRLYDVTGVKPCISVLKFNDFKLITHKNETVNYNTDTKVIDGILAHLDSTKHRISLCEHNSPKSKIKAMHVYDEINDFIKAKGFETKIFGSFGAEEHSACGLLSANRYKVNKARDGFALHYEKATTLLHKIINEHPEL
ncbi:MAG: TIR domain-containing protein [Geobacteraceae bacterium]|nr:TIR domain-containing protein [Geobacteraceae bacterium]